MRDKVFIDTNLLIYIFSDNDADSYKKQKVIDILKNHNCVVSTQVLNELCNVFTRKLKIPVSDVRRAIAHISKICTVITVEPNFVSSALTLHENYKFSYFDCLMITAAIQSGCTYLVTEDMHSGQNIDNLKIINIFNKDSEI